MQAVIELAGWRALGDRRSLKDLRVSLSGRTIGLLGPNGAGKSTLIQNASRFLSGIFRHRHILGYDIRSAQRQIRAVVGYMPEN